MYPPQQYPHSSSTTIGTQNPMKGVIGEQAPPPPPTALMIPIQETRTSGRSKAKMIEYLKLDAPKYKEGDDPCKYVNVVKMIADELSASDSRVIHMAGFTLKCKKAKEWYKDYVTDKVGSMTSF
ncbi:hypothetical protein P3X46_018277 [Hevea brasiliensis]|uniref:Uncharacterized protein n=1 Tax=Hevea brasiliensis TaxID=3981 RepID=A0ABQ9LQ79_HEVBR|nr:hypothetical protein P3X46_018277 [Hevea brasiliensis]